MGRVFYCFFSDLFAGDPVALIAAGGLTTIALVICFVWWRIARNLRREDEERQQRYGGKKKT